MRNYLFAAVITLVLYGVQAWDLSWIRLGSCPGVSVKQGFQVKNYMGTWYTQAGYNTKRESVHDNEDEGRCSASIFSYDHDRQVVNVTEQEYSSSSKKWFYTSGTAVEEDPSKHEGKLEVTYITKLRKKTSPYWVLDTDYINYSVVYRCTDYFIFHYYSVWLLSRKIDIDGVRQELSNLWYAKVKDVLTRSKIDSTFKKVDQGACYFS